MKAATRTTARIWLGWAGTALVLASVVFIGARLYDYSGQLSASQLDAAAYGGMAGLAIVYGACGVLLAVAWHQLLRHLKAPVTLRWAVWAYATSQLGKYIPGNVFQFAGRQAIGATAGLAHWPLAKSTAWELAMIAAVGFFFAPLVMPLYWPEIALGVSISAFLVLGAATVVLVGVLGGPFLARAALCHYAFLLASGFIFVAILILAGDRSIDLFNAPAVAGAFVVAWLIGLLTPGAPAGLGVREAVLVFLLGGFDADAIILLAIVMSRAVTVVGDLMFYAVGRFALHKGTGNEEFDSRT